MKIMIVFIGLLTILAGVLPFFEGFGVVPFSGPVYSGIIILIGVIAFWYAVKTFGLWGSQKFITAVLALSSGPVYSGIIILIGVIAVVYGKKQF